MTDPGDLSPSTSPAPQSTPQPQTFEQRRQAQERMHTPPPRQRQPQAPNSNVSRNESWPAGLTPEGRYVAADRARRADALAADGAPNDQTARDPGAAPDRGAGDPTQKSKLGDDLELTADEARGLIERDALEKSRALTLPQRPEDYKAELPKNFKTPQGIEFQFNEADPALGLARDFAHRNGLSQAQFSEMAAVYAATKVREIDAFNRASQAEIEKLGAAGTPRVTAVINWLRGTLGDKLAGSMAKMIVLADHVDGFEKLMGAVRTQGSGSYSNTGREPPKSSSEIPGYATMTFEQRRAAQERGAGRR
jgi:hypothetical protein